MHHLTDLKWKLLPFVGLQTLRQTRAGFHSAGKYNFKAVENVWNRLYGENSFEKQFNIRHVEEVSEECETRHVVSQLQQIQLKSDIQGKVKF